MDGRIELMQLSWPRAAAKVTIGGQSADLVYAGWVPYGWAGLLIVEVTEPAGLAGSDPVSVPVAITAGGTPRPDNRVAMWVRK